MRRRIFANLLFSIIVLGMVTQLRAQTVNVSVNAGSTVATVPDSAVALHTSVYSNQSFTGATLASRLDEAGVQMLRYPGGSYSDIFHWSIPPQQPYYTCCSSIPDVSQPHPFSPGHGADPTVSNPYPYGYHASGSHFANFVRLLDNSGSKAMITVNYGSSLGNLDGSNVWRTTKGGQPQEAAAWVAYANADPSIYGTPSDVVLGVDQEGINWRTAGYWAKLRASANATDYQTWAQADGVYNPANAFLAINRPAPVGIEYWEVGNEINGNGYYASFWNWENDYHHPYGGNRTNQAALSPTAYGNNFIQFANAMKAVDPSIKVGGVLVGPGGVGDTGNNSTNWDRNALLTAGNHMDFGILHWYVDNDPNSTSGNCTSGTAICEANFLSATAAQLPNIYQQLRNRVDQYTNHDPNEFEFHMTEFGYFKSVGDASVATGLFSADVYATALKEGAETVHYLEMSAATFLNDSLARGPAFRASQMVDHLFNGGEVLIDSTSSSANVKAHAVRHTDGSVALMLINLGTSGTANVNVEISDATLLDQGTQWQWGSNVSAAPVESTVSGLGNSFTISVPQRTMTVLLIPSLSGDFNSDGIVDAADYVVWRKDSNLSTPPADYATWSTNFGRSLGSGSQSGIVPEVATLWSLVLGALILTTTRRQPVRNGPFFAVHSCLKLEAKGRQVE
jgi:hypothetical protein